MDVLQSLNNILYTLLSDAEARNFDPPVPATVVAEIETLIGYFRLNEQFRILPGGTIIKLAGCESYIEHFDPSIERIKWIKQFREYFRCSLKEAHDLSIARSGWQGSSFVEFLHGNSNQASEEQMKEFERERDAERIVRGIESRSIPLWGN